MQRQGAAGVAARCCCQSAVCALDPGCWCRCGVLVLLQGAAVRVLFVLWSLVAGAAARCRRRVPFPVPTFFLLFGVSANRVLAKPCRYTRFHCVRKTGLKGHLPRASVIGQNNGGNVRRNGGNQQKNGENFRFFAIKLNFVCIKCEEDSESSH